jgi:hypothetical protein
VSQCPSRVFRPPCTGNFHDRLDSLWLFATRPIVGSYLFNILIPVGCNIIFVALLAFVDMTVKHLRVLVKVFQRLDGVALKTTFRTNHVELQ